MRAETGASIRTARETGTPGKDFNRPELSGRTNEITRKIRPQRRAFINSIQAGDAL